MSDVYLPNPTRQLLAAFARAMESTAAGERNAMARGAVCHINTRIGNEDSFDEIEDLRVLQDILSRAVEEGCVTAPGPVAWARLYHEQKLSGFRL